ncbi:MAG: hypothetical protein Q8911_13090 [Bacillota bacterium]|nr:hypothetical protein [Bacillota bacterium]
MNHQDIKRVIERLEPDDGMEYRLSGKLRNEFHRKVSLKPLTVIAAGLLMIISIGAFVNYQIDSATTIKLSKNQNDSLESLLALLPNNKVNEKSTIISQGVSTNNSSAQLSESKNDGKSGVNSPKSDTDSSKGTPPENKTNLEPRTMTQNESVDTPKTLVTGGSNAQNEGKYIPKAQLPGNIQATAKMMGLIVYQGKIYIQSPSQIDFRNAEKLMGEKLGTTNGTITEWSNQDDYAVGLASTVGVQDVYTVKGYDRSFRIMTAEKIGGEAYAYFFECLNDMTVKTGNDIFGKFKMENNVESVNYEDYDSSKNGKETYKLLTKLDGFNMFLAALENSIPHEQEGASNLLDELSTSGQKLISIKLNDGSEVLLRLLKD